ncbi:Holliday junction resolvase RuvX [Rothia nasimurium]|uniref:Holliday junction resolvase RuvX n=1 Tax=Rothia nasimurium TaxID=85336 RepID=UPI001F0222FF|nr:Holliday junction resolvase RuvX [Rothia nasimurium]
MGVDVGNARVGLALCDPDGILATPLKTLRRDLKKNSDRRVLRKLLEVNEVTEVFVGLPKTMRGGDSPSTHMAREYAQALAEELAAEGTPIPVWLIDERLTTVSAHRSLHEAGVSSKDFKTMVDQVAAVNILQHALDTLKAGQHFAGEQVVLAPTIAAPTLSTDETENPNDK